MSEPIGNKRPPVHTRFKKGQSGNPRGRPKGALNIRTDLLSELAEVIVITEGGAPRKITKRRAIIKATTAKAIKGDGRAAAAMIALMVKHDPPEVAQPTKTPLTKDDEVIVAALLKRHSNSGTKP